MEQITTKDGSVTYHSEEYGEAYHSLTGAKEEAIKKYAEPCRIAELAKDQGDITLLDVCFGLGYNSAAAIDAALDINPACRIVIIALENDQKILDETGNVKPDFRSYGIIKEAAQKHEAKKGNVEVNILFGDARKKIKDINEKRSFDAVFLDPFSPKRCPELWTERFLSDIHCRMKKGAILATYSCAKLVRENMKKAGFEVKDGPVVGRRAPATLAIRR